MIYKYTLNATGMRVKQELLLPLGAQVLSVQNQHGYLVMWVELDPSMTQKLRRVFDVFMTAEPMEDHPRKFLDTVQFDAGTYVVHVYERL